MANDKDFVIKNAIDIGKDIKVNVGSTTTGTAVGYSLANASYDAVSFDVSTQIAVLQDITFNNDGTKLYATDASTDSVYQYSLSTAFDLSTISYDSVSFSFASQDATPQDITFNNDGTKMYISGGQNDSIYQYTLSTAFNVSTASYDSVSFSVNSEETNPTSLLFNNDGTKMYVVGPGSDKIHQYTLSTAFDLSTASYDSVNFSLFPDGVPSSVEFNNDGTKMFVGTTTSDSILQYSLSTAFDISTLSYDRVIFSVANQDASPGAIAFSNDGTKMYIGGAVTETIYQYSTSYIPQEIDLSTGNYFTDTLTGNTTYTLNNAGGVQSFQLEVTGGVGDAYDLAIASYDSVSFSVASQTTSAGDITFSSDGTKAYVISFALNAERVYQYSLSTAYDVGTMSYDSVSFNVNTQAPDAVSVMFNPDGTKMYIGDFSTDSIYQYTLSTAFDLSTASYDSVNFSANSEDTSLRDAIFSTDGTKLYIVGTNTDSVYQYSLSTAFDISTASYDSVSFDVSNEIANPYSLIFNADGTKMFVSGSSLVQQYDLPTGYDLSTASVSSVSYTDANVGASVRGLLFNGDGTKMYWLNSNTVYQYTTGLDATITWPTSVEWPDGIPYVSPPDGEKDLYTFTTDDNGTTYKGVLTAFNLS